MDLNPHLIRDFSAPTVLVDPARVQNNVQAMSARARAAKVAFRPHFKTHQSIEVGAWMRAWGVERITVSSVSMAEGFVAAGWTDLTIALPAYPAMLARVAALIERGARIGLLVDHPEAAVALARCSTLREACAEAGMALPVWVKVDAGYGRAGVRWDDELRLREILEELDADWIDRVGLLAHSGHTYSGRGREQIAAIHEQCLSRLLPLRQRYADQFSEGRCKLSVGDTPSCSLLDDFGPVDEIRPGNFVFYDLSQLEIGACQAEQIAACVLCPVIGKDEQGGRLILHGGAVHLSKDRIEGPEGPCFGWIAPQPYDGSWQLPDPELRLSSLSQEHGIVALGASALRNYRIGDFVQVFPVHSCLACDLHREYRSTDGQTLHRVR
jgi:D-serine deaminase-like pyridoxal phosphate-dependent protein